VIPRAACLLFQETFDHLCYVCHLIRLKAWVHGQGKYLFGILLGHREDPRLITQVAECFGQVDRRRVVYPRCYTIVRQVVTEVAPNRRVDPDYIEMVHVRPWVITHGGNDYSGHP